MILTDREIRIAIAQKLIDIEPHPSDRAFASTTVDLTLGSEVSVFRNAPSGIERTVDPSREDFDHDAVLGEITDRQAIDDKDGYLLDPKGFILAWTEERIDLKIHTRIAARVEGKSSLARLGLGVHITAPTIHAGFSGQIRLEILNHGFLKIRLKRGMRICQLVFEQTLGTPERGYQGRFAGQDVTRRG